PNRNLIWGRNVAEVRDMALDAAGNVYTTGRGGTDVYVSKLDSTGSTLWTADILRGGPGNGVSFGIAVDGSGNVYTSGYFTGIADFDPGAGTYTLASTLDSIGNSTMDAFVSKLVPSTALQAAGGTALPATGAATLSAKQVTPLLPEALARSRAAGVNNAGSGNRQGRITNLRGMRLDLASGNTITLDDAAAGWGWFVDPMAGDVSKWK